MRLCLITSSISPHQLPLAQCLVERLGSENFRYVSTGSLTEERRVLGWCDADYPEWVLQPMLNQDEKNKAQEWCDNADVVLCGNREVDLFKRRCQAARLTFYMSERWFKPPAGMLRLLHPGYFRLCLAIVMLLKSPYFFYLPMGVYAAKDMHRLYSFFKGFCKLQPLNKDLLLWGYFIDLSIPIQCQKSKHSNKIRILWVGRFLRWKRIDLLIAAIRQIDDSIKRKICIRIIGMGPQENRLKAMAKKYSLLDIVEFLPPKPIDEIRMEIRKADICVVTSNAGEGWGVTVNEIMAEQSCVIASDAAGASATLIKHKKNGLLFKSGSSSDLAEKLMDVLSDEEYRRRLAVEGRASIIREWLPEVACDRLLNVANQLLAGENIPEWNSGPCSPC